MKWHYYDEGLCCVSLRSSLALLRVSLKAVLLSDDLSLSLNIQLSNGVILKAEQL